MGRYSEWLTAEGLTKIKGWARDGLTNEEIAENIGIAARTLYNWRARHEELEAALREGKAVADYRIEGELFRRATGYEIEEVTMKDGVEVKRVRKHVPADVTAAIFWLKNRQPEKWSDRRQIQASGALEITDDMAGLSEAELKILAQIAQDDGQDRPERAEDRSGRLIGGLSASKQPNRPERRRTPYRAF